MEKKHIKKVWVCTKEFWLFLCIVFSEFHVAILLILLMAIFRQIDIFVYRKKRKVLWGLVIAKVPLDMLRPDVLFNKEQRKIIRTFVEKWYKYLSYVTVARNCRWKGLWMKLLHMLKNNNKMKVYFRPLHNWLIYFYKKGGAHILGKDGTQGNLPVMFFN